MAPRPRPELQTLLETLCGNVYFQPPPSLALSYPCIVYEREDIETDYADNVPWNFAKRYSVTIIDRDPDSVIPDQVAKLPTAAFDRHFTNDGLNHDVFRIFF